MLNSSAVYVTTVIIEAVELRATGVGVEESVTWHFSSHVPGELLP